MQVSFLDRGCGFDFYADKAAGGVFYHDIDLDLVGIPVVQQTIVAFGCGCVLEQFAKYKRFLHISEAGATLLDLLVAQVTKTTGVSSSASAIRDSVRRMSREGVVMM